MVVVLDGFNNLQDIVHAVLQSGTVSSADCVVLYCGIGSCSDSVALLLLFYCWSFSFPHTFQNVVLAVKQSGTVSFADYVVYVAL